MIGRQFGVGQVGRKECRQVGQLILASVGRQGIRVDHMPAEHGHDPDSFKAFIFGSNFRNTITVIILVQLDPLAIDTALVIDEADGFDDSHGIVSANVGRRPAQIIKRTDSNCFSEARSEISEENKR